MVKEYTTNEMADKLGINSSHMYRLVYHGVPEEVTVRREESDGASGVQYIFTEEDFLMFKRLLVLTEGMTLSDAKERLAEEMSETIEGYMVVNDVAEILGTSPQMINHYRTKCIPKGWGIEFEDVGPRGRFLYTKEDVELLKRVRELKNDMTYDEVRETLKEELFGDEIDFEEVIAEEKIEESEVIIRVKEALATVVEVLGEIDDEVKIDELSDSLENWVISTIPEEPLYRVVLPDAERKHSGRNMCLVRQPEGHVIIGNIADDTLRNAEYAQLTEAEIKKNHAYLWDLAVPVTE